MSVAFRRDSDEEHREPKFEIPLPAGPNLVTRRGLALIEERIAALDDAIAAAADGAAEALRRELRYWHTRRTTAMLTDAPADGRAGFGTVVAIRLNGRERRIAIVGDDEADPAADRIGPSAPLAQALIGAEAGETVAFAGRENAIEILAVAPIDASSPRP